MGSDGAQQRTEEQERERWRRQSGDGSRFRLLEVDEGTDLSFDVDMGELGGAEAETQEAQQQPSVQRQQRVELGARQPRRGAPTRGQSLDGHVKVLEQTGKKLRHLTVNTDHLMSRGSSGDFKCTGLPFLRRRR